MWQGKKAGFTVSSSCLFVTQKEVMKMFSGKQGRVDRSPCKPKQGFGLELGLGVCRSPVLPRENSVESEKGK